MPGQNEATTRKELIDPALGAAGWDVDDPNQVGIEIPIDQSITAVEWQAARRKLREVGPVYRTNTPICISDYLL